jgi:cytoskeletal protein CcmA (bactofilin family)
MRDHNRLLRVLVGAFGGLLLLAGAAPAFAADIQQGQTVVIGPDQVVNDDVYAFGTNVQILGTVNGDVFAAGNIITVGGTVTGGVFAAGNTITVTGDVRRGVHAAGGTVTISGPVAEDAVLASGTANLAPGASIGRDALLAAATIELAAPVARDVRASAGDLTLAAPVGGNVQTQVTTLRLTDGARVQGALTYTSQRDAEIAPGAVVGAGMQRLEPQGRTVPTPPVATAGWAVVDWLKGLVGLAVIGLLFIYLLPRFTAHTLERAKTAFWSSLGVGFGLLIGVPIAAVLVFVLGILLGGWMLGLALLASYAMACAVGYALAAMYVGKWLVEAFRQPTQHLAWNLLEGLALLGLVGLVPFVGGLVTLFACIFGTGAVTLSIARAYRASRAPSEVVAVPRAPVQPQLVAA